MQHRLIAGFLVALVACSTAGSQAQPTTALTYQAQVTVSGQPLNQAADFQFRLYDASEGGTQDGEEIDQSAVNVQDGLFTVLLDYGTAPYESNSPRWLEIDLRSPAGSGDFTTLSPRQLLTSVPSALSLALPYSASASAAGCLVDIYNTSNAVCGTSTDGAGSTGKGVSGTSGGTGTGAAGVFGQSTSFSGTTYGGYFESFSPAGTGVFGSNTAFTGNTYGGYFISQSPTGYGVYGANSGALGVGVYGESTLSTGTIGVSNGNGGIGVYGGANSPTGTTYAVYGSTVSSSGWAGYFIGGQGVYVSGSVGIGTTTPSEKLYVVGNICATGTIGVCSDARFKDRIEPVAGALDKVSQLRGVTFDWKRGEFADHEFSEARQVGFLAQEVEKVLPEVVSKGSDGYLSVDYGRLTPVLVEALKEESARVRTLETQNQELRERLERIEQAMERFNPAAAQ